MSIIERAARELAKKQSGSDDWDALDAELQRELKDEVRAVLQAVREPSDAMKQVAVSFGQAVYPEDFWVEMIDAALAEPN
ncbi:hypothetical protein [Novosphingobium resinovorum]|uniref:Uncharacterized protein n=1 Tax=Novosphingobium resinovorum TaxID=158500 RepID=A0A1D8A391_9SPHN|nr:hypothetical protein [Novosphingobium resinovorum]AOR76585.1 hypothetical protein BES08_07350 [Novosphingobium resinovorum]